MCNSRKDDDHEIFTDSERNVQYKVTCFDEHHAQSRSAFIKHWCFFHKVLQVVLTNEPSKVKAQTQSIISAFDESLNWYDSATIRHVIATPAKRGVGQLHIPITV